MTHRTSEEILAHNRDVLGEDYGLAFHHCCQELWRVSSSWDRYEALFANQERVDLLNRSSGNFWYAIQGITFESVLLGLCRLTDPPKTGSKTNLSVKTLVELEPSKHKVRLRQCADYAIKKTAFARTWRDKRIAHNDFEQLTGLANKLAPATRRKVTDTIVAIHDVLRWIHMRHFDGNMTLIDLGDQDAMEVMGVIADGLKYEELRQTDHKAGKFHTVYERPRDWMGNGPDPMRRYEQKERRRLPRPLKRSRK
jgi:hypothetical protein